MTTDAYIEKSRKALDNLFREAKAKDEFEYACSLLRIRGMEDPGWDPLHETHQLIQDMLRLLNVPLLYFTQLRLALLTYCHLTEVDAIYSVIENLLLTIEGKRCSVEPFWELHKGKSQKGERRPPSASKVVIFISDHARKLGQEGIAEILAEMFNDKIRNSFFHSDYILFEDEYRSREKNLVIKLSELVELMNRGIDFYQAFMEIYLSHRTSYKEPKIIMGYMRGKDNPPIEVELITNSIRGLIGIRSPRRNPTT